MSLQLVSARMLHVSLFVPVFLYGSETMIQREKERSRIMSIKIDNLKKFIGY